MESGCKRPREGTRQAGSSRAAPGLGPRSTLRSRLRHQDSALGPASEPGLSWFQTRPRPLVRTLNPIPPAHRPPGSFRSAGVPAWETEAGSVLVSSFLPLSTPQGPQSCLPPPQTRLEKHGKTGGRGGGRKKRGLRTRTLLPHSRWRPGAARSLRGGTSACAARSPGPGHKMAGAALGRERRRRQNGRPSRTYSRIPSSPLRAVADARNSLGPRSLHC